TPAANANGSATVTVSLKDDGGTANGGVDTSATQAFTITVAAVNDAPTFTKGADQTVNEDAGGQTVVGWATAISTGAANESGQALSFQVSNDNTALFSAQPAIASNGTLTYAPAANANGSTTVTVSLKDDGGTANGGQDQSAEQTFTIKVNPVNDPPALAAIPDRTVHAGTTVTVTLSATDIDQPPDTLTYSLVAGPPTASVNSATKTFTWLTTDADAGSAQAVTVRVADNGTPGLKDERSFTVNVVARPTILSVAAATGSVTLTWTALAGTTYRVQYKPGLTAADWTDLSGDVPASGSTAEKTDSALGSITQRFYRIQVVP
ncbi:MAG: hypothetical protein HYY24_05845, partial [Verrucomicrobia bacterium]|nr:hypothetical protein [Verrucomicrobiota bacterium]